jgi:hypothetical protein
MDYREWRLERLRGEACVTFAESERPIAESANSRNAGAGCAEQSRQVPRHPRTIGFRTDRLPCGGGDSLRWSSEGGDESGVSARRDV